MPRDFDLPEVTTLPQDVRNLLRLADALEREHEDFKWDFTCVSAKHECGTSGCAIGMAMHIGLISHDVYLREFEVMASLLSISWEESASVFGCHSARRTYGVRYHDVTAAMVARELRRIAAEKMV